MSMSKHGLLFASALNITSFPVNSLQMGTDKVVKYCNEWNFKFNLTKTKIIVFKKEN
jgi:hypothetical protein